MPGSGHLHFFTMANKWIGAFLGFITTGSILGSLAGFAVGALFDAFSGGRDEPAATESRATSDEGRREGQRNSFLFSLMVLSAHIIQADGKIMHSEMEYVRDFLRRNFGETAREEGEAILLRLFEYRKQHGAQAWNVQIEQACGEMAQGMPEEHRIQLLAYLCEIAKADGNVAGEEVEGLRKIARWLFLGADLIDRMLSLGTDNLDDAYTVLGLTPQATDEEVRRAYKQMALKHHPDRVATLGDDVKESAKRKFQEINDAKEKIFKARGMR